MQVRQGVKSHVKGPDQGCRKCSDWRDCYAAVFSRRLFDRPKGRNSSSIRVGPVLCSSGSGLAGAADQEQVSSEGPRAVAERRRSGQDSGMGRCRGLHRAGKALRINCRYVMRGLA